MPLPKYNIKNPWIIAHRGAMNHYMGNTIEAYDAVLIEGVDGFCLRLDFLSDTIVEKAYSLKKPVLAYTCNNDKELQYLQRFKISGILSNDPKWLTKTSLTPKKS